MDQAFLRYLFSIFLLANISVAEQGRIDCQAVERNYQQLVSTIKNTCSSGVVCQTASINWDLCAADVAHTDSEIISQLIKHRAELQEICHYPSQSCSLDQALRTTKSLCYNQKCRTFAELQSIDGLQLKLLLKSQTVVLKNQEVKLMIDTGIRCVTAPCPSSRELIGLKTNDLGEILLTKQEILEILTALQSSPDGTTLSVADLGFVPFQIEPLLINSNQVAEINFP